MDKFLVTIFTPTYNRGYILPKLYESLCCQTEKDFEWVIVDDGSSDNTPDLIKEFKSSATFPITYIHKKNGGKHRAINEGVKNAKGKLFFIVDSDDQLTPDAIEWIKETYKDIENDNTFSGLSGIRISPDGSRIGGTFDFGTLDCSPIDFRLRHRVVGDMAEVFKTEVLKKYPFPEFEGEFFCPEALIWNRIGDSYKMRFVHRGIYVCEYRPDGLTAKITKLRKNSPKASMLYYSEFYHRRISISQKIKAALNFWRFSYFTYDSSFKMTGAIGLICYCPGKLIKFFERNI